MAKSPPKLAVSTHDPRAPRLNRLRNLSRLLDDAIKIPGIGYRIGLDPIIGLIPGGGDTAGLILSSYIVLEAARLGASKSLLSQMVFNILLETVVGTLPVLADLFDVTWKSNARNMQLLEAELRLPHRSSSKNHAFAIALIALLALVFVGCLVLSVVLLHWLVQTISGSR